MSGILRVLLGLFSTYGLDVFQIGLIVFLFWKLFTNHLAHIAVDLHENNKAIDGIRTDVKHVRSSIHKVDKRVAHVEGQLEAKKQDAG